jgi:nitrous oxidase accessory protein NosD
MTTHSRLHTFVRLVPFAAVAFAMPAAAKTVQINQSTIVQAMAQAQPGDTLVLAAGGYGTVALPRKSWQTPITIDARAAQLSGVVFFKTAGVTWLGGRIVGTGYGVSIRDSDRITVKSTEISDAVRGIVINNGTDIKIQSNKLHDLQTDGIDVVGQRILVEGNVITDMKPVAGDHPDGIQIWSANDEQTTDVTVRNNTVTGMSQGIFARSTVLGLRKIVITGNKTTIAYGNGIVLLNAQDSTATGNTVKSVAARLAKANMRIEGINNVNCGNVVPDVPTALANLPCRG